MNNNIKKAAIIMTIAFTLSGCGANTTASQVSMQNQGNQPAQGDQNGQDPFGGPNGQNNRTMQFQAPDLMGEVSAISGNEITVKVISIPAMGQGRRGGTGQTSPGAFSRRQAPDAGNGQTPDSGMNQAPGNDSGMDQAPPSAAGQNQTPGGNQGGRQTQRSIQYTGETKVLKLTDSVTITQTVRGDNGITSQAIQIADLKVGDTLQVYYSDKTNETISKITVGSGGGWGMGGGRQQRQQTDSSPKS